MANLYLMCGVPGAGKSTFIKKRTRLDHAVVVSRDAIRFSIVKPDEEYFSHEDEVVKIFWEQINKALAENKENGCFSISLAINMLVLFGLMKILKLV